ncbi:MAG: hypothetical protein ACI92Z_001829 [Paracoccaceae bacterium]|jgi:hypothetical protein
MKNNFARLFSGTHLTIWVIGSVLAATAGPFGSYKTHDFPTRFLYWILVFCISSVLADFCGRFAKWAVGSHRPELVDLIKVAAMVVVFTPVLILLTNTFVPGTLSKGPGFMVFAQSVAIVSAAVCIARRVLPGFEEIPYGKAAQQAAQKPKPIVAQPRLTHRLPSHFKGPILQLAVDVHFVDVVTANATHRIRLRFVDAINEMNNVEGFCTHRSHWVARDAIIHFERVAGRVFVRINNQDLVPVSRKYKPKLEDAGIV